MFRYEPAGVSSHEAKPEIDLMLVRARDFIGLYYEAKPEPEPIFPDQYELPILFYGPVPFINVRYPTDEIIETCPTIHLTAEDGWNMDLIPLFHSIL